MRAGTPQLFIVADSPLQRTAMADAAARSGFDVLYNIPAARLKPEHLELLPSLWLLDVEQEDRVIAMLGDDAPLMLGMTAAPSPAQQKAYKRWIKSLSGKLNKLLGAAPPLLTDTVEAEADDVLMSSVVVRRVSAAKDVAQDDFISKKDTVKQAVAVDLSELGGKICEFDDAPASTAVDLSEIDEIWDSIKDDAITNVHSAADDVLLSMNLPILSDSVNDVPQETTAHTSNLDNKAGSHGASDPLDLSNHVFHEIVSSDIELSAIEPDIKAGDPELNDIVASRSAPIIPLLVQPGSSLEHRAELADTQPIATATDLTSRYMDSKAGSNASGSMDEIVPLSHEPEVPSWQYVCVLGASMGGPEAVKKFLDHVPVTLPVTFIYVQHIDPTMQAVLPRILSRHNDWKFVTEKDFIEQDDAKQPSMRLAAGQVLIVPALRQIEFGHMGEVYAYQPIQRDPLKYEAWAGQYRPSISAVVRRAARAFGTRIITIVFSGMGDDGSDAVRAVQYARGLIWAQTAASCVCSSQPDHMRASGQVSFNGSPDVLAQHLQQYVADHSKTLSQINT